MKLTEVFNSFCEKLSKREGKMTEDNIRYYWFAAMYEKDDELNHYTLEEPYDKTILPKKELDLLYKDGNEQWAIEMKFHRYSPDSDFAHTDAAGSIFNDLMRLQYAPIYKEICSTRRLFLYVTDDEMDEYFKAEDNIWQNKTYRKELRKFYTIDENILTIIRFEENALDKEDKNDHFPDTFTKKAFDSFVNKPNFFSSPKISLLYKREISELKSDTFKGKKCYVRLYEVLTK